MKFKAFTFHSSRHHCDVMLSVFRNQLDWSICLFFQTHGKWAIPIKLCFIDHKLSVMICKFVPRYYFWTQRSSHVWPPICLLLKHTAISSLQWWWTRVWFKWSIFNLLKCYGDPNNHRIYHGLSLRDRKCIMDLRNRNYDSKGPSNCYIIPFTCKYSCHYLTISRFKLKSL